LPICIYLYRELLWKVAVFLRVDTVSLGVAVESDSPLSGYYGNDTLFGDWYRKDYKIGIKAGVCVYKSSLNCTKEVPFQIQDSKFNICSSRFEIEYT